MDPSCSYHLSSGVCSKFLSSQTLDFYKMHIQLVFRAEDESITVSRDFTADICISGFICINEKCTEEEDGFIVGVKAIFELERSEENL